MRIDLYSSAASQIASDQNTQQVAANSKAKVSQVANEDRATLTSDATSVGSLVSAALKSPEVRQDKVDSLRQAVSSGQYKLDAGKIAASIIDEHA